MPCEILGYHTGVAEVSSLLGRVMGKIFPKFQRITVHLLSEAVQKQPQKKRMCDIIGIVDAGIRRPQCVASQYVWSPMIALLKFCT
jgi:hypothetical protein